MWCTPCGRIMALAQFRDNVLVAFARPRAASDMRDVCDTLSDIWRLPVLCPCMQRHGDACTEACMGPELRALGICIHKAHRLGTCIAHPSAFTDDWSLKLAPRYNRHGQCKTYL